MGVSNSQSAPFGIGYLKQTTQSLFRSLNGQKVFKGKMEGMVDPRPYATLRAILLRKIPLDYEQALIKFLGESDEEFRSNLVAESLGESEGNLKDTYQKIWLWQYVYAYRNKSGVSIDKRIKEEWMTESGHAIDLESAPEHIIEWADTLKEQISDFMKESNKIRRIGEDSYFRRKAEHAMDKLRSLSGRPVPFDAEAIEEFIREYFRRLLIQIDIYVDQINIEVKALQILKTTKIDDITKARFQAWMEIRRIGEMRFAGSKSPETKDSAVIPKEEKRSWVQWLQ